MSRRPDRAASAPPAGGRVIYQHPLAYLLGLEGIALLRAFAGEYDREFTLARIEEIRALLHRADELGDGVEETPMTIREGYAQWAPWYDEPGNELLEVEEPVIRQILDGLPVGVALDAACGTGRHAAYLASLGHRVIGVDATPEMLDVARAKVPAGEFHDGDLHDLPLADASVDVVVCGIAVSHVPELEPVLAELARVLRRGGHLVLSDSRGFVGDLGLPLARVRPDGTFGYIPVWSRLASDYLAAALPLGFEVRRCEEVRQRTPLVDDEGRDLHDPETPEHRPGRPPITWALHRFAPEATNAAHRGRPQVIVWHFQLAAGLPHEQASARRENAAVRPQDLLEPPLARRLSDVGLDPRDFGDPREAWRRLHERFGRRVTLVDRYALEAAGRGIRPDELSQDERDGLTREVLAVQYPGMEFTPSSGRSARDPVKVTPYREEWAEAFRAWRERLSEALGETAARIEHVGSTAVPGLAAKPVVDIQIGLADVEDEARYVPPIEALGVALRTREPGHRYFRPAGDRPRTVQIHVCEAGGEWEREHLLFRDYLRAHPRAREAYARLKRDLAGRYRDDRIAYNEGKTGFILDALDRARAWAERSGWDP